MEISLSTASSGPVPYHRNLDQAAVIVTALEQIFRSAASEQERRQAAAAYISDELVAVERQAAVRDAGEGFPSQLDLAKPPPPTERLSGLAVQPQTICRRCGDPVAIVGPGTPPHYASLRCRSCDVFRGWLPRAHGAYLTEVVAEAGVPRHPIPLSGNHGIDRDPVQARPLISLHQQN
jgi:hypothetical protein